MIRLVLLRLLESYFRHRWLYLFPVFLLMAVGVFAISREEQKYIAGGVLYVQQESFLASLTSVRDSNASWWVTPAESTVNEINELIRTNAFVRAVIQNTDLEENMSMGQTVIDNTFQEVRDSIWISVNGDNQVTINAAHLDDQIAYQLVNATIENYIQWKINTDRVESEVAQVFFEDLIDQYETDVEAVRGELESYLLDNPAPLRGDRPETETLEIDRLEADLELANIRYARALQKDEEARLALAQTESDVRQSYFLIDAPRMPEEPAASLMDMVVQLVIFTTVGAILSGVGIVGNALLDRSLRFPLDVKVATGLPLLTIVPDATPRRGLWARFRGLFKKRGEEKTAVMPIPILPNPVRHSTLTIESDHSNDSSDNEQDDEDWLAIDTAIEVEDRVAI